MNQDDLRKLAEERVRTWIAQGYNKLEHGHEVLENEIVDLLERVQKESLAARTTIPSYAEYLKDLGYNSSVKNPFNDGYYMGIEEAYDWLRDNIRLAPVDEPSKAEVERAKIYRAWINSNHKIQYTLGYFYSKKLAEQAIAQFPSSASGPETGIEEITMRANIRPAPVPCPQCNGDAQISACETCHNTRIDPSRLAPVQQVSDEELRVLAINTTQAHSGKDNPTPYGAVVGFELGYRAAEKKAK